MKCLLSANAKDEHNIIEWIHYHLLLGFDHILVWDDFSEIPIQYSDERVKIIKQHSKKNDYISGSVVYAKRKHFDWIIHLDIDEYLYLGDDVLLKDFCQHYIHNNIMAMYFPWTIFGSNHINQLSQRGSCLEPFTRCDVKTHNFIKTLARVEMIKGVKNPHEFIFSQQQTQDNTVYAPNKTIQNFSFIQPRQTQPVSQHRCFIAHFRFQSWDIFCERKGRVRDDILRPYKFRFPLGEEPVKIFHRTSNQIVFPYLWGNYRKWK